MTSMPVHNTLSPSDLKKLPEDIAQNVKYIDSVDFLCLVQEDEKKILARRQKEAEQAETNEKPKILFYDHAWQYRFGKTIGRLKSEGHDITTAEKLEEALELCKKSDVMYMHFNQSGDDNAELVKRILQMRPDITIHLMSGLKQKHLRVILEKQLPAELLDRIVSSAITVPVGPNYLEKAIEKDEKKLLARRQAETNEKPNVLVYHHLPLTAPRLVKELREEGYTASPAISKEEALELCGKEKFDTIFMHFNPRGEDGIELVKAIHRLQPNAVINLVLTDLPTHLNSVGKIREQLPGIALNFLGLPVTHDALLDNVCKDGKPYARKK